MAKFDLAFPYKTKNQGVAVLAFISTFAASILISEAIIVFAAYAWIWSLVVQGASAYSIPAGYFAMLLLPLTAVLLSCLGLVWLWDEEIHLSDSGLSLSNAFLVPMLGRVQRSWDDLLSLQLSSRNQLPLDEQLLTLRFKTGGHARIDLSLLSTDAIEQLLLSLEVWGRNADKDPLLLRLQSGLHEMRLGAGLISYTQIWEEEMNRRFGSTAFIPLEPGHQLQSGRLRVLKQVAFGGLSAIYLAQLNKTEAVIIKESVLVDTSGSGETEKAQLMFAREAHLLAKLNHPQIARMRDYFVEQGRHYVVLDYLPGDDLKKIVKAGGSQSEEQVLRWALEIAQILQYLHDCKPPVVHRDLTPDNLVFSAERIVLIDFGAANQLLTMATGTLIGKQSYIAPEQFRGNAVPASDIYALGCTLHFLLTGYDPEPLSVSHPRRLNARVSSEVDELVAACTTFAVNERIQTASQLIERLESLIERRRL